MRTKSRNYFQSELYQNQSQMNIAHNYTQTDKSLNETAQDRATEYDWATEYYWITVGTILLTILVVYVSVTQIIYCVLQSRKDALKQKRNPGKVPGGRLKLAMNILICIASFVIALRGGIGIKLTSLYTEHACQVYNSICFILLAMGFIVIYIILWLRQLSFYASPYLKRLVTKPLRIASWSIVVCATVYFLAGVTTAFALHSYKRGEHGCINTPKMVAYEFITIIVFTVMYQITLLGLFIYPLVKHKSVQGGKKIHGLIRRVTFATLICIVTDAFCSLLTLFWKRREVEVFTFSYFVTLVINLVSIITAFGNWRRRFVPFWMMKEHLRLKSSEPDVAVVRFPVTGRKIDQENNQTRESSC